MSGWNQYKKRSIGFLMAGLVGVVLLNVLSAQWFRRMDLTMEKRYTLAPSTRQLLDRLDQEVTVTVYLDGRDLPAGIRKLRNSTRDLLNEFRSRSGGLIQYEFVDVFAMEDEAERLAAEEYLLSTGLYPMNLEVRQDAGFSEKLVYPGAVLTSGNRGISLEILENQMAFNTQDVLNHSYNFLEFKLASTINKLILPRPYRVAVSTGHGEPDNSRLSGLMQALMRQEFQVQRLDLSKQELVGSGADVLLIVKPRAAFSEQEKFSIDQFLLHGGKVLWMIDRTVGDLDSFRMAPEYLATSAELNLDDQLFQYGVRLNPELVGDIYCSPVPVTEMDGGGGKTRLYPWIFHPVLHPPDNHPVTRHLDPVQARFAGSVDTVRNPRIHKTVLLATSEFSSVRPVPALVDLGMARTEPHPDDFDRASIPVAVLLEGSFVSAYEGRFTASMRSLASDGGWDIRVESPPNRMIVIADGDMAVNDLDPSGIPLPLGYYRYTRETFANRDFLLNCMEYLLDDEGLILARNRESAMQLLDRQALTGKMGMWQFLNVAVPLAFMLFAGGAIRWHRHRRYAVGTVKTED